MNEGGTNKASGIIQIKYSGLTTLFTLILFIRSAEIKPAISQERQKNNRHLIFHSIFSLLWTSLQLIYGGKAGLKQHYSEVSDLEKQKTSRISLL